MVMAINCGRKVKFRPIKMLGESGGNGVVRASKKRELLNNLWQSVNG